VTNAKQHVPGFPESTHHVGFCYAINWNEVFIYLWGHDHTPIYTQHSMMKYLLKLTSECLRNDTCRCKKRIEAVCHQGNDKHYFRFCNILSFVKKECIGSWRLAQANVNQKFKPFKISKQRPRSKAHLFFTN